MSKPQVYRLMSTEQQYDFILIGIICQRKDHKLCYEINRKLEIDLVKCPDYELFLTVRKTHSFFAKFGYKNPEGDKFILLSNKGTRGILLQEQPQLDYLFMITENQLNDSYSTVVKTLKDIPIILGAFALDPLQLPSREYLILE
jgi:hypothetical protein